MTTKLTIALAGAMLAFILAGQAQALTMTNHDEVDRRLEITETGDEALIREVVIAANETLDYLCQNGCTIAMDDGKPQTFGGGETVTIEDGRFVTAK